MNKSKANIDITFRPLTENDFALLHEWLNIPHVSKWRGVENGKRNPTMEEVCNQWIKRINKTEPVDCFIVFLDQRPFAYIQWYHVSDFAESKALVSDCENLAGIDVFIGEPNCLYRGLGPVLMSKFLKEIVFASSDIKKCMIDPDSNNAAAIRAYEKVGFKHSHTIWDAKYKTYAYIMLLTRNDIRTPPNTNKD